jgi:hypothetical protein
MMLLVSVEPKDEKAFLEALNTLVIEQDPRGWFEEYWVYKENINE